MSASKIFRFFLTILLLGAALFLGRMAWDRYMDSAWTRDGRVKADVVTISADVAGTVTEVLVRDNQLVHKGDVLFVVDKARYENTLAQANAALRAQQNVRHLLTALWTELSVDERPSEGADVARQALRETLKTLF